MYHMQIYFWRSPREHHKESFSGVAETKRMRSCGTLDPERHMDTYEKTYSAFKQSSKAEVTGVDDLNSQH